MGVVGATISDEKILGIKNVVGNLAGGNGALDTDNDGMPDDWEGAHGLTPQNPTDAMTDEDQNGRVNVEEYINTLVN